MAPCALAGGAGRVRLRPFVPVISVLVELAAGGRLLWAVHVEARGGGDSDRSTWQGLPLGPDVPSHLESEVHCCRVQGAQMAVMISYQGIWAGKEVLEVGMVGTRCISSPPPHPPAWTAALGVDTIC